jgi:peptide/nickel transport system permease protein
MPDNVRRALMRYVTSRPVRLVVVLIFVTMAAMLLLDLLPGSPGLAIAGENASQEQIDAINEAVGLDEPFFERYAQWVTDLVTGDLGSSIRTGQDVSDLLRERAPITLEIALLSMLIALIVAIPVGVFSGSHPNGKFDRAATTVSSLTMSVPSFLLGVTAVYLFAVTLDWFPVSGWVALSDNVGENLRHVALPVLVLGIIEAAQLSRLLRNDMVATMGEQYILAARARGLPRHRIVLRHALRPSAFSLITVAGVAMGRLLGGTVIIELIFSLPGLGQLMITSVQGRDYLVVRAVAGLMAIAYVLVNIAVDLAYPLLDPRLRRKTA